MLKKLFKKFSHPLRGIAYAVQHDAGFQFQLVFGVVLLGLFIYFFRPFTQIEIFFLAFSYTLVLITELQNSSFEIALDRLHPELHESIKQSKDMAAGAVLLAGILMITVMVLIVVL